MQPQSALTSPWEEAVGWGRWPLETFILYCSIFSRVWRFWQDCGYLGCRRRLPEALLEGTKASIRQIIWALFLSHYMPGAGCWGDSRLRCQPWSWHLCGEGQTSSQQWWVNGETTTGTAGTNPQSVGREGLMEKVASELRNRWQGRTGWVSILGEGIPGRWNSKCKNSEMGKCLGTAEITVQEAKCHNGVCTESGGAPRWRVSMQHFWLQVREDSTRSGALIRGWISRHSQNPAVRQSQDWLLQCLFPGAPASGFLPTPWSCDFLATCGWECLHPWVLVSLFPVT